MQVICDLKVNRKHIFGLACCRTCAKLAQSFNNAQFLHSTNLDMIPLLAYQHKMKKHEIQN